MSNWEVSDVVQLLKTFGVSREALIFVFRHNIDGATMDESVELLVKDFDLGSTEIESNIIAKWKDISTKGLLPKEVLSRDSNGKVIQSPTKAVMPISPSQPEDMEPPAEAVITNKPVLLVNSEPKEEILGDTEAPPSRAQFTHLKSAKWSRSGKFSPKALQIEEEPTSAPDTQPATDKKVEEGKQEEAPVAASSPFRKPPMACSPSFKRSVKVFRFDDDTVIEIPAEGEEEEKATPQVVPQAVPEITASVEPAVVEIKVEVPVEATVIPIVETAVDVKEVKTVEVAVDTKQTDSAQTTEENTYDQEDWEAEMEELHKHSIVDESPDLPPTSPAASKTPPAEDTVGFEPSTEENIVAPDRAQHSPRSPTAEGHDDMIDPDLDAIIAKQTEEYNMKVASSRSPFHSPTKPHQSSTSNNTSRTNTDNNNSSSNRAESDLIQKYEADLQKQAELLRLQQEQIALQRQLIEQQRRDLTLTSESPRRMSPKSLKKSYKRIDKPHNNNTSNANTSTNNNSNTHNGNGDSIPVRAGVDFNPITDDEMGEPFYADNSDHYYTQVLPAPPSMLYDSISMLSDSGVFDATYHNNIPFPGIFMPESSITSANSGEYENAVYRNQRDLSPSPLGAKKKLLGVNANEKNGHSYHTNGTQDSTHHRHLPTESPLLSRFDATEQGQEQQQYGEVLSVRPTNRSPAYDHTSLAQGSTDSAGHVWHHVQPASSTRRAVQRPHVPALHLGAVQEQTTHTQPSRQNTQEPETTSPGENKVPDAALADLMNVLKELALTNAALTQALRPAPVVTNAVEGNKGAQLVPATSRSAPAGSSANGRGRRGTFISSEEAAASNDGADKNKASNDITNRPAWDPHHTDQASLALNTAHTEPRGRPKSRQSSSTSAAKILRAGSRGSSRSGARRKPEPVEPSKPVLQDYLDLLAKEFAARPLHQAPYYSSNVVFNVQQIVQQNVHQNVQENTHFDAHPVQSSSRSSKRPSPLQYNVHQALTEEAKNSYSPPFGYFNRSFSPNSSKPSSPKAKSPKSAKSPTAKKGGFIFLDQGPTELQFEGPHYAAPQDRSLRNSHSEEPRSAVSSPGRRPVSRGPGKVIARPASAIGIIGNPPFGPIVPLVAGPGSAATGVIAAPPGSARPSTSGSRNRSRGRMLVQAPTLNT